MSIKVDGGGGKSGKGQVFWKPLPFSLSELSSGRRADGCHSMAGSVRKGGALVHRKDELQNGRTVRSKGILSVAAKGQT